MKNINSIGSPIDSILNFGGNANNGAIAGAFYLNGNNASSNRNRNVSAHVCLQKIKIMIDDPVALAQICCQKSLVIVHEKLGGEA